MTDFYRLDSANALRELNSDANTGLTQAEAAARLEKHGRNALPHEGGASLAKLFFSQFANLMVVILLLAAVISFFLGDIKDVIIILVIAVLNAVLGTYQEFQAEKALEALSAMQVPQVRVRRDGKVVQISAEELVPGDIVLLGEGDKVPADGRVIESANLQVEEAALTGESQPIDKNIRAIDEDGNIPLGDRKNMVYMGTAVNYGRGAFVVTSTALQTELGKIAAMLMGVEEGKTPLQKRVDELGKLLVVGAIVVVGMVFIVGLLRGIPLPEMLTTAISLAVAAVPEGLPAIITIGLSLGASRMVQRNALIRRLPAVETLGSVTVICSDKTGTLTKNEMTATQLSLPGHGDVIVTGIGYQNEGAFLDNGDKSKPLDPRVDETVGRFLRAMALATDAHLEPHPNGDGQTVVGDTTEGALLVAAQKVGWNRADLEKAHPRVAELPFSSDRKAMTTIHDILTEHPDTLFDTSGYIAITKGAPDRLIEWASHEHLPDGPQPLNADRRAKWQQEIDTMASKGLRVLGIAYRPLESVPAEITPEIERGLYLLGLVGILDPSRPEAKAAVAKARSAGIRPVMITGDHGLTAQAIATDLGIIKEGDRVVTGPELDAMTEQQFLETVMQVSAFARVSPEHKLRLVKALQAHGEVAAMTGDGVNDAPALKQADIGVAMGITGTEVSKGAADMVLTDDNFASIVAAVEEGRIIYDNILKFVRYLLSSNIGEILVMFIALLVGWPIPLLAIQILWVNLVTDGLPAIALGFERGDPSIMERPPRPPKQGIFANGLGMRILYMAVVLTVVTLGAYVWAYSENGLNASEPSLGLERLNRAQVAELTGEEVVPTDWDSLTAEERIEVLHVEEGGFSVEESDEENMLANAERIPRTMAFTVLAFGQIFHVLAISAGPTRSFFRTWFKDNKFMLWAVLSTLALQIMVIYLPFFQATFETVALDARELAVSFAAASLVLFVTEIEKLIRRMTT